MLPREPGAGHHRPALHCPRWPAAGVVGATSDPRQGPPSAARLSAGAPGLVQCGPAGELCPPRGRWPLAPRQPAPSAPRVLGEGETQPEGAAGG